MKVAIVGVGTIGAQAAYHLARRGESVVGYEQFTLGHAYGSAGGDSRFFSRVVVTDPRYSEVIARAEELWRDLNRATGTALLDFTGGIMMGDPDHAEVRRSIESIEMTSTAHMLSPDELSTNYPEIRLNDGEVAVFDPHAGRIDPELTNVMTARLARAHGAEIRESSRVLEIDLRDDGVAIRDATGWASYDRVIITAGAWTTTLLGALAPQTEIRRLTSAWYFPKHRSRFDGLVPFMRIAPDYVYGLPTADGRAVKIGLGFDHHVEVSDPDRADRWIAPGTGLETFRERLTYFPGISDEPFRVATYFETYSPNRREYMHELPGRRDVLVLTGFSGHGFKVAPAIGEAAADWASDGPSRYAADLFTP